MSTLGGSAGAARPAGGDLEQRYAEPHRRYHTGTHVRAVLADGARIADDLALAAPDRALLTRLSDGAVRRVEQLILLTLAHEVPAEDAVAAALLDADLAILAAAPSADLRHRAGDRPLGVSRPREPGA